VIACSAGHARREFGSSSERPESHADLRIGRRLTFVVSLAMQEKALILADELSKFHVT
jgi:hypothetical protein